MGAMRAALLVAAAACADRSGGGGAKVTVHTGAPNATVLSHRAGGAAIDEEQAGALGDAVVTTEDGALISIAYPAGAMQPLAVVTAPAPAAAGELTVTGPALIDTPPPLVGTLAIEPAGSTTADHYDVELGCVIRHVTDLTQPIFLPAPCLGSDTNVDVLVHAYAGTAAVGYLAGRAPFADGGAILAATWHTTTTPVPITLTGVTPTLDWVLTSDGLPFDAQPIAGTAPLWTDLVVDAAIVHATQGAAPLAQIATLAISGAPTAIAFGSGDFLAPIAQTLALDASTGLALTWSAADPGADALDLHLTWTVASRPVAWDAVLPPDATSAAFPAFDSSLAATLAPPDATPAAVLRYVDGPATGSFADVVAAGLVVDQAVSPSTIVALPASGELRESDATGYAP
jgi:hypothetical protein